MLVFGNEAAQLLGDGPAALLRCGGGGLGRLGPAAWVAPVPARCAAAYCFCRRFFCHSREMGLLDASWGFSMTDFCQ